MHGSFWNRYSFAIPCLRSGCICTQGTEKTRRGGESNPRIGVLQTPALPLGYPADERRGS